MVARKYFEGDIHTSDVYGDFEILEYINSKKVLIKFINTGYQYWTSVTKILHGGVKDTTVKNLVFGVGICDIDYVVEKHQDGKRVTCPFYQCWRNMLARCYHNPKPSYVDCVVHEVWLRFSVFKAWMEQQDWEGKQLDKDLLFEGNRVYGPDTCLFVTSEVNGFIVDKTEKQGGLPLGVTNRRGSIFIAQGFGDYLGSYKTAEEAHDAWKEARKARAIVLSEKQTCSKTREALLKRYA